MMSNLFYPFQLLSIMIVAILLLLQLLQIAIAEQINATHEGSFILGVVIDCNTRVGKEERVAIEMAIEDLKKERGRTLSPRIKCSYGEPFHAAVAARNLIYKKHAQVILGPRTWEETSVIAEAIGQSSVPILSFMDSSPSWAIKRREFLIQAAPSTFNQMKAVAAIIKSWGWRRVNVIYEDIDSLTNGITPHLYDALQEVEVEMKTITALHALDPSFFHKELEKLKRGECRVFIVHSSLSLATRIFEKAKEMKMMEDGYVWITTDSITGLVHSVDASAISNMQGVLGVRTYFQDNGPKFHDFYDRFCETFGRKYPEEKNHEPGAFALQAYDVTQAIGLATSDQDKANPGRILEKLSATRFSGLSGEINLSERGLAPVSRFQLINVIGKSYREHGYWHEGFGFTHSADDTEEYDCSMKSLGQVFWPGGPWSPPKGWDLPTIATPLRIGVPNGSITSSFVKVKFDPSSNQYTLSGFSISIFNEIVRRLPFPLPYQFIPFEGTYTALVEQVQLKNFDAAVGDIAVTAERSEYVEFTRRHTEEGLVMVVPVLTHQMKAWLFMKPFTKTMWLLTAFVNIYNGFVVWMIEKQYCSELRGSILNQIGMLIWLAFATLFSLHGEKLHSYLSRIATVVWLFVALIIMQSYTASLTSMLTVQKLGPKITNIETLKNSNDFIGCSEKSFVRIYLQDVLGVNRNNIRGFSSIEGYVEALRGGEISAAFLEVPVAKLFVAKYCKSFVIAGPTYRVGGYGFAFPKGSPLLPDIDKELLNMFDNVKDLETNLIASEKCVDKETAENEIVSLSPQSFFVLFILTGCTSTAALGIYYFSTRSRVENNNSMPEHKGIWKLIFLVLRTWNYGKNRPSRKVSNVEMESHGGNSTNTARAQPQV